MDKLKERDVAGLWRCGLLRCLKDDLGNQVTVLCPGRDSTRPGCDFQDAVILVNGNKQVGNIEVHVTSDLWMRHGHHLDSAYNCVMLHAALWQRGGLPVSRQDGSVLPTVLLGSCRSFESLLAVTPGRGEAAACPYANAEIDGKGGILFQAGLRRLEDKAERFLKSIKRDGPMQALYSGICRALGYATNSSSFEELAGRLTLEKIGRKARNSSRDRLALLMGAAGLLPSQRFPSGGTCKDGEASDLECRWKTIGSGEVNLDWKRWNMSGLRPFNHPVRRLAALGVLLGRHEGEWVVDEAAWLVKRGPAVAHLVLLEKGLQVAGHGYWACHYDFGHLLGGCPALVGQARARGIALNVVLPFLLAFSQQKGDAVLEEAVLGSYIEFPASESNELIRYMEKVLRRGLDRGRGACLQQGLLGIYYNYCREKECNACPVFLNRKPGPVRHPTCCP